MENFEKNGIKYTLLIITTTAICMMLCFLFMFKCESRPVSMVDEVVVDTASVDTHASYNSDINKTDADDNLRYGTYLYIAEPDIYFYAPGKEGFITTLESYVKNYINMVAPDNKIDPYKFLSLCKKYDVDIFLIMSHAQLESNFGTRGNATKTNSLFNLNKNGEPIIFDDINDSIEPYLIMLIEYLTKCDNTCSPCLTQYSALLNVVDINFVSKNGIQYKFNFNSEYIDELIIIYSNNSASHVPEDGEFNFIETY